MTIGISNRNILQAALEPSKVIADQTINGEIDKIAEQLRQSLANLRAAGQTVDFKVEEVVERLNAVKNEWLEHVGHTFDSAILRLKSNLR